jgi:hypothetical protein
MNTLLNACDLHCQQVVAQSLSMPIQVTDAGDSAAQHPFEFETHGIESRQQGSFDSRDRQAEVIRHRFLGDGATQTGEVDTVTCHDAEDERVPLIPGPDRG